MNDFLLSFLSPLQAETMMTLATVTLCSIAYCFIVGEITMNNSQMDKLWSILPAVYTWIVAVKGGMDTRLVIMAVLATIWGARLTYNFGRKGAYSIKFWSGEEDYRWIYLRKQKIFKSRLVWMIFDLLFIAFYQNVLVLLTTLPAVAAMGSDKPLGWIDCIAIVLMAAAIIYETVADEQQWKFQTTKHKMLAEGKKLSELPEPYNRGFNTTGLWNVSRHPNYLAEQSTWLAFYIFSIAAGAGCLNWSVIGAILLILLFQGSVWIGELISSGKYPEFKEYKRKVSKFFPCRKYVAVSILCFASLATSQAQVCQSGEWAFKVKQEAFENSKIQELSEYMTDLLGSRLAASQMKLRAEGLVVDKLNELNFANPRSEKAFDFEKGGWDVEKTYAAMTAPYYCAFTANPKAWTGSTDGLVKGECIVLEVKSESDIEKYKGKLEGKIVLLPATQSYQINFEPLASRLTDEDLEKMKKDNRGDARSSRSYGNFDINSWRAQMELQRKLTKFVAGEKPLCIISGRGTFNVPSSTGASYKQGEPEPLPELVMPIEDHGRMCRLIARGVKVEMELELRNKFTENGQINNVYAEIPGTDSKLKDEIVMIGAHLDSWHGGTGGADNASGCIVMMEAMRILKAIDFKPKRTIRLALWGGEEQGLYGSRGYASIFLYNDKEQKKLAGYDKFALYLNMDNGSGRFRGIHLERNDLAFPFFEAWMKPIESLGFTTLSPRTTGSTDHVIFNRLGLPAYQFIQDGLEYGRTYHTIMDTYERLSLDDLRVDACITAWLVLCAANDPGRIPVKPGYPEVLAKQAQQNR